MSNHPSNPVASEGRRLVLRGLLIGGVAVALFVFVARSCRSTDVVRSSGVGMVFRGVTNISGSNYVAFTITNHPGYLSFHYARFEALTSTGWSVVASNLPIRLLPGISLPLSATNERVRVVFEVGTGTRPPFDWMQWFWPNRKRRMEFLTNEITLPPPGGAP